MFTKFLISLPLYLKFYFLSINFVFKIQTKYCPSFAMNTDKIHMLKAANEK